MGVSWPTRLERERDRQRERDRLKLAGLHHPGFCDRRQMKQRDRPEAGVRARHISRDSHAREWA